MALRKRRKKDKLRGQRTHGKGNTKNKRGAGSRGGRGRAGSHKHKYSKYYKTFGGKKQMKPKKKPRALNLSELNSVLKELVEKKKAEIKGDEIFIDGKIAGIGKILSRGKIEKKLVLKNVKVSKKALEKITTAGGRTIQPIKKRTEETKGMESEGAEN